MKHQIESDGKTVWINAEDGSCIARFGRMGIDIHRTMEAQLSGKPQCLMCTHGITGVAEWEQFTEAMKDLYNIKVDEKYRPERLKTK